MPRFTPGVCLSGMIGREPRASQAAWDRFGVVSHVERSRLGSEAACLSGVEQRGGKGRFVRARRLDLPRDGKVRAGASSAPLDSEDGCAAVVAVPHLGPSVQVGDYAQHRPLAELAGVSLARTHRVRSVEPTPHPARSAGHCALAPVEGLLPAPGANVAFRHWDDLIGRWGRTAPILGYPPGPFDSVGDDPFELDENGDGTAEDPNGDGTACEESESGGDSDDESTPSGGVDSGFGGMATQFTGETTGEPASLPLIAGGVLMALAASGIVVLAARKRA